MMISIDNMSMSQFILWVCETVEKNIKKQKKSSQNFMKLKIEETTKSSRCPSERPQWKNKN